jgi:hypothetical protein
MTITSRVQSLVRTFPGYPAGYYCAALDISRSQFRSVARRHLVKSTEFSYDAWFPKGSLA